MGKRFSGYFSIFSARSPGGRLTDHREHVLAVPLELGPAYTTDPQQRLGRARLLLGDQLERGVGEHHERRHALLPRALLAPLAQSLEQLLVVGRRAVRAAAALLLGAGRERLAALTAAGDLALAGLVALGPGLVGQQR